MTRFQLRRLALQATRRPDLLPVLQDALLESAEYGPKFEVAIQSAHERASRRLPALWVRRGANDWIEACVEAMVVGFSPRLGMQPFVVYKFVREDLDRRAYARAGYVPVYVVPIGRHL